MKSLFEYDLHKIKVDCFRRGFKDGLEQSILRIKTNAVLDFDKEEDFSDAELAIIVDLPIEQVKEILSSKEKTNNPEIKQVA